MNKFFFSIHDDLFFALLFWRHNHVTCISTDLVFFIVENKKWNKKVFNFHYLCLYWKVPDVVVIGKIRLKERILVVLGRYKHQFGFHLKRKIKIKKTQACLRAWPKMKFSFISISRMKIRHTIHSFQEDWDWCVLYCFFSYVYMNWCNEHFEISLLSQWCWRLYLVV